MKRRSRNFPFVATPNLRAKQATILFLTFGLLLTACQPVPPLTPSASAAPSPTPFQPATLEPITLRISDAVPDALRETALSSKIPFAEDANLATFYLDVSNAQDASMWAYALVAPFPTVTDGISGADLREIWQGNAPGPWAGSPLWMAESTEMALSATWGAAGAGAVRTAASVDLLNIAWQQGNLLAIIPFEEIQPRWKVLTIDGQSPIQNDFIPEQYPLMLSFGWYCTPPCRINPPKLPAFNRDPNKLTVLMLTGVTALARTTAYKMETKGLTYPAQDVGDWLRAADITHISSEVSFAEDCPPPNPYNTSLRFCSDPRYIEFFKSLGIDVVEVTGNHLLDWGKEATLLTFDIYDEARLPYYGGGRNLSDALTPVFLEHNGHPFAFVGCNIVGPDYDWADEDSPGALPCEMDALAETVRTLRADGYLPIVTLQYYEYYSPEVRPAQGRDFRAMVDAGAVIVSGSQAHFPQAKEFYGDAFIDYGLGNLFFDQMDQPVEGTRREFIDRHVFYDGRYISTELLTALLMDYARPAPMTDEERAKFLTDIFEASAWLKP